MKRIKKPILFIVALFITLALFLPLAPSASAAAFYSDIRVLISIGSPKSLNFSVIGDYYLMEDPSFTLTSDKMTVSAKGGRPVLMAGENTFTASTITLISRDYGGTSAYVKLKNDKYGTCTYLGNMLFDVSEGGIRAINTLPLEHYLYGVVSHEMDNTWPVDALKTQAVCARGYAISKCFSNRLRDYDIGDTSSDQVYHGYASRYTRVIAAVDETAGQVLTYEGDFITAYYSASNGGQTELSGNPWKNNLPYLLMQDDPYDVENTYSLEQKTFIPSEFTGETLPLMDALVLQLLQKGADETAGEAVTLVSTVRAKAYDAKYDPPSRCYTKADVALVVKRADGSEGQLTVTINFSDLIHSKENPDGIFNTSRSLRVRSAEQGVMESGGVTYEGWYITNRGYGHGIGMSQRGAQQRATAGQSYADILAFYYAGTQLCTIGTYAAAPALTSDKVTVSEDFISGVKPGTTPDSLISKMSSADGTLSVVSASGSEKVTGRVYTGDLLRTLYNDGASYFDLPVVIYGDTDGDGRIAQSDLDALRQHMMSTSRLSGVYLTAADVNHDGTADSLDMLQLLKHIQGASAIEQ